MALYASLADIDGFEAFYDNPRPTITKYASSSTRLPLLWQNMKAYKHHKIHFLESTNEESQKMFLKHFRMIPLQ